MLGRLHVPLKGTPIVFPVSVAVLIVFAFFTVAYKISEAALDSQPPVIAPSVNLVGAIPAFDTSAQTFDHDWYEKAAILFCPLH